MAPRSTNTNATDRICSKPRASHQNSASGKRRELSAAFDGDLKSELLDFEKALRERHERQLEDVKGRMLSERAAKMKFVRDKHAASSKAQRGKLENELSLENETRLS